jgi:type IV pilus assembly protein PilA
VNPARRRVRSLEGDRGFTLIELMVVVLVIAILLAIAIPTFLGARTRGQDAVAKTAVRSAAESISANWSGTGAIPDPTTMITEDASLAYVSGASTSANIVSMAVSGSTVNLAVRADSGRCITGVLTTSGLTMGSTNASPCQAAGSVTAPSLPGLIAWYDASDATTVTAPSGTVSTITDKSGNGNTAAASLGSVAYVTAAQNGLSTLRFNGSSTLVAPHSASLNLSGNGLTIVVAYKASSVSASYAFINKENTWEVGENGSGAGWTAAVQGGCWTWVGSYAATRNQWHTNTFRYSPSWLFTVDSGAVQTAASPCGSNISPTSNPLTLGGRSSGSTPTLTGDIGEVMIWNRSLTDAENDQVRTYMKAKWGTP